MNDCTRLSPEEFERKLLTRALGALAVSQLTDTPMIEICPYITDGFKDGGIDLIYFEPKERTLYLAQTKWHTDGQGSIDQGDTLKFLSGVKKVLENNISDLNSKIQSRKLDIERALYDANAKFVLVLAHTGQEKLSAEVEQEIRYYVDSQNDTSELMSVRVLSQAELHKAVAAGVAGAPISLELQLYSWGQVRSPHPAYYGQVCAADVSIWMEEHGSKLFEKNLRHFIGGSLVNQDIVNTLLERPEEFWYFNNGITALVSKISKKPIGGSSNESGIFECESFSVVNGAQTVGSIFHAATIDKEKLSRAMVPIRIISSENSSDRFSSEVTRYTNTQNAIEKRDFVALDDNQERIRQELQIEGISYAYKAGAAINTSGARFDLTEATVALACIHGDVSMAVQAKREISKLWEDITKAPYKQIFNSGVTGPAVWQAVQAIRAVDIALQEETRNLAGRDALICTHGNRFIQWAALKKLGVKLGSQFSEIENNVSSTVKETILMVIIQVRENYADSYPASLFKNLGKCRELAKKVVE